MRKHASETHQRVEVMSRRPGESVGAMHIYDDPYKAVQSLSFLNAAGFTEQRIHRFRGHRKWYSPWKITYDNTPEIIREDF